MAVRGSILSAEKRLETLKEQLWDCPPMALDPIEWIVIGIIVVVIFMWGPSKIPEFARSLARARKELDTAKKEFENPSAQPAETPKAQAQVNPDDVLIQTARRMGISTEGKTREQITNEMVAKTAPKDQAA